MCAQRAQAVHTKKRNQRMRRQKWIWPFQRTWFCRWFSVQTLFPWIWVERVRLEPEMKSNDPVTQLESAKESRSCSRHAAGSWKVSCTRRVYSSSGDMGSARRLNRVVSLPFCADRLFHLHITPEFYTICANNQYWSSDNPLYQQQASQCHHWL